MLTHTYLPKIGGREIHVSKLSEELVKRGHKIVIITSDQGICPIHPNVQIIKLNEIKLRISSYPETNYFRVLPMLHRAIAKMDCDVVHMHDLMHYTTDSMTSFSKILNIPTVLTIHGFKADTKILGFLVKLYNHTVGNLNFHLANRIILPSRSLCKTIPQLKNFKEKLCIIPNGVDLKISRPIDSKYPINLLAVGRLVPRKGFQYLIEAMPNILLHHPDTTLNIVGPDGGFGKTLLKTIVDLNLSGQVRVWGKVSESKLEELYRSSSICINPSTWDNVPLTILEALSWGKPVVASDTGGIPEMIKSNYNGMLVQSKDTNAISEAVITILNNPNTYRNMASNALESAKTYSWENIAKCTEKVYEEIL